jgi:hypothetical protein
MSIDCHVDVCNSSNNNSNRMLLGKLWSHSTSKEPSLQHETRPKLDTAAKRMYFAKIRELAAAQSKNVVIPHLPASRILS